MGADVPSLREVSAFSRLSGKRLGFAKLDAALGLGSVEVKANILMAGIHQCICLCLNIRMQEISREWFPTFLHGLFFLFFSFFCQIPVAVPHIFASLH